MFTLYTAFKESQHFNKENESFADAYWFDHDCIIKD